MLMLLKQHLIGFLKWCENNTTCALQGRDVASAYDEALRQIEGVGLSAPGCNDAADTMVAGHAGPRSISRISLAVFTPNY